MMYSRAIYLAITAIPILAAANPVKPGGGTCSTGPVQCCDSTEKADSKAGAAILSLLGIVLQDVNVLLGINCSPIIVIGVGNGGGCSAQTVCCQDNSHGGLVSIGCIPITL